MGYAQFKGRKPFERASKIAHSEILNNPDVLAFVESCTLPSEPAGDLESLQKSLPHVGSRIETVIAVDGGMSEATVRRTKAVRAKGASSFSEGVRSTIHEFLFGKQKELGVALQWLLFRGWKAKDQMETWDVPKCPNTPNCGGGPVRFGTDGPTEMACGNCGQTVFLSDALRLYERIDDEQGAGGVMSYLLTTLEQLVIVNIIRTLLNLKPSTLREILLIKDGPLAFFGMVAPLRKPMQDLMSFLADKDAGRPLLCLVGLEKSGAFVEHAMLIEPKLKPGHYLLFTSDYIYRYILPGDPTGQPYGLNTYYGSKLAYKSPRGDVFVATIPVIDSKTHDKFENLQNAAEVLRVVSELRCSMYDQALIPIVLANKLVSLADFPSSEILARFVRSKVSVG